MDTKKPPLRGFFANSLQFGCSAVNVDVPETRVYINIYLYIRATVVCAGLFRLIKKNEITGVPASPIADSIPRCERIKTDYNSCMYTWCRLIVLYFNNLYEFVRLARGMVFLKIKSKTS